MNWPIKDRAKTQTMWLQIGLLLLREREFLLQTKILFVSMLKVVCRGQFLFFLCEFNSKCNVI